MGWNVLLLPDKRLEEIRKEILKFVESSRGCDSLFAFVGHGIEVTRLVLGVLH